MTKITNQALNSALNQLWVFSLSSDFWEVFDAAFGTEYNRKNAEILRSQWQIGDFSQLPEIEILDSSILGSANGAYSSSENRIYLSSNLMENGTSSKIREVLIEEIGHFVDSRINQIDTPGDEGEYFAHLLTDQKLNKDEIDRLKAEDDRVVVTIDGKGVEVEQNNATLAIAPANASQTEGNSGTKPFTFTVTRTGDTSGTSSANWAVTGSGINPANATDFGGILPSGTVNFAVGETSQTITINVSGDTTIENDEGFTVTLSDPIGAVLGTSSSGNTINESASGGFGVTEKYYNISSPGGTFQLNYDMYGIPDRAEIFVNNVLQNQTTGGTNGDGFVSGSGSLNLNSIQLKAGDQIKVTITGNVQGTAWDYNVNYTGGLSSVNYIASGLITNDDNPLNSNVVTPKVNISTGLIFTAQSNGNITLDTNRGSATPDEVTSVQNGTESNFDHIIGLYEVLNSQGEIKDNQGNTLKPGDANYALHALTTARVKNFTVQAGGNDTPSTATQLGSGVSVLAGKLYAPFAIANGGTYFPGNQGIEDFVAAEQGDINRFSAAPQYVRNLVDIEGKNGDIFNNAPRFVQEPVAYFSFGAANPDVSPHFRSYGNGVYGFEDLPVSYTQYSNNDFNDGVFALTLSI
ncbi:hypothetical protein B7O87_05635 [Cylindrospermopsis raciborskii CENA303]|uniref:Calx-beta domain-containing protein n=1 Tax=Cylindrospermopsis raciborskii CENA303 TaxID=1170769 RepID=A0A1X4G999_9CYAN|nr:DUF4114 domain-containing protein [Cylindrospermopsis raciborskii]OSO93382.1 hypothetical protein B7O87_05635 [Cylindrospermopsis raciborskii CENA303]